MKAIWELERDLARDDDAARFARTERKRKRESARTTYLIESAGLVKIGTTLDLDGRFRSLASMCATEVMLLAYFPASAVTEAELHERFASARDHGEWFRLTDDLAEFIATSPPNYCDPRGEK